VLKYALEEVANVGVVFHSLTIPKVALSLTAVATLLSARVEFASTFLLALAQIMQEETTALPLQQ